MTFEITRDIFSTLGGINCKQAEFLDSETQNLPLFMPFYDNATCNNYYRWFSLT